MEIVSRPQGQVEKWPWLPAHADNIRTFTPALVPSTLSPAEHSRPHVDAGSSIVAYVFKTDNGGLLGIYNGTECIVNLKLFTSFGLYWIHCFCVDPIPFF